jgi:CheY-like chemotaxis protein
MAGILLIDAEQPFSDQMAAALRSRGYPVKLVDDGKDVVEQAMADRPDLIVLCVELPRMSGYSICNKLKRDGDLKPIPLIITSKEATPETFAQHRKLKTRAEEYLIKPFTDADLADKIAGLGLLPSEAPVAAPSPQPESLLDALDPPGVDPGQPAEPLAGGDAGFADFGNLDALGLDARPQEPPTSGLSDEALFAGLDALDASPLDAGIDSLRSSSSADSETDFGSLDALPPALADLPPEPTLAREPEPAPQPEPAPRLEPPRPVIPPVRSPTPRPSTPPSSAGAADLLALQAARRETADLKARVAELEARLRHAEDAARASSALSSPPTGTASSAREVLHLKQQMRAKDDEILQKEQALVDVQEQLEKVLLDLAHKTSDVAEREIELSTLRARLESMGAERDDLEAQVGDRLQLVESERDQLRAELDAARGEGEFRVEGLEAQLGEATGRLRSLEADLRALQQRLRSEEQLRDKARQAAEALSRLLSGDGKTGSSALEV